MASHNLSIGKGKNAIKLFTGAGVKKVAAVIKKGAAKVVDKATDISFALLLPFKPIMKRELAKANVPNDNTLSDIVPKFVKHIVQNHSFDKYEGYFREGSGTLYFEDGGESHNLVDVAIELVREVIEYFKRLKAKKAAGEQLTANESEVLNSAETVADLVVPAAEAEIDITSQIKDFIFSWKGGVLLLIIGVGLFFVFKKK